MSPQCDTVGLMVMAGLKAACCRVGSVDVSLSSNSQETLLGGHKHRRVALHPEQDHKNPLCETKFCVLAYT